MNTSNLTPPASAFPMRSRGGVYLDCAATSPVTSGAMMAFMDAAVLPGNPSSVHAEGMRAAKLLESCRENLLKALGVKPPLSPSALPQLVFTSGGTEADNLALLGVCHAKKRSSGGRVIISAGEHPAIRQTCAALAGEGFEIIEIPTDGGRLDLDRLRDVLTAPAQPPFTGRTVIVSIMTVNNETGAVYDVASAFGLVKKLCPDAVTHTDATQAFGKIAVSPSALCADLITVSSHKIGGLKGTGALYISPELTKSGRISATTFGGGQERGLRSGTENLPGIAAFAAAAEEFGLSPAGAAAAGEQMRRTRDFIIANLPSEVEVNAPENPAPHILSLRLPGIKSETMLRFLSSRGFYISSGSACSAKAKNISYALTSFGLTNAEADCTIRVSPPDRIAEAPLTAFLEALSEGVATLTRK